MNVGMLGAIQSIGKIGMNDNGAGSAKGKGFASLFASLQETSNKGTSGVENLLDGLLGEVDELVALLQTEEFEGSSEIQQLIAQLALNNSDEDLVAMLLGHLGMTDEEWANMLHLVQQSIQDILGKDALLHMNTMDEVGAAEQLEDIMQILAYLGQMTPEQLMQIVDKDMTEVVKAGRLLDVLLAHRDAFEGMNDKQRDTLANNLKQLTEQLEALLQARKDTDRRGYLLKTFAQFKNEAMNGSAQDAKQTVPLGNEGVGNQLFHLQQVPRAEQLTLMLESNGRQTSTEQLIKQFNAILSKSQFFKEGGTQRMFVRLYPEHLGAMRIELIQRDQMMVARILTSTAMARNMLDSQLHSLKQAFVNQNIQVERIEISQQLSQQDRFLQKDNEAKQQSDRQNDKNRDNDKELDESFGTTFEDALVNTEV